MGPDVTDWASFGRVYSVLTVLFNVSLPPVTSPPGARCMAPVFSFDRLWLAVCMFEGGWGRELVLAPMTVNPLHKSLSISTARLGCEVAPAS